MINTEIRLIIFFAAKGGEALYSQQKQDKELTMAQIMNSITKFRLKLKKVGKTTRWFRYDLNQIPYNYTVEVTSRFRQLDLMTEYLKNKDGGSDQDHPQEEEMQKGKMVAWGGLTSSWEQKRRERQRRKGKIHPFECRVCKEIDENNRMGKTRDIFKKVKDSKGTFHEKKGR